MKTTFKRGHKFDFLDMFTISPSEVQELFWKEFWSKVDKKKPNLDNLKVMLESGLVNVNATDEYSDAPLLVAAYWNSLELAKLLISSGAEVNAKDKWGKTPLHLAAMNGSLEIAQLLISSGADLEAVDEDGWTPLHTAAYNGNQEMVELLQSYILT